jgi:hypothetical protein
MVDEKFSGHEALGQPDHIMQYFAYEHLPPHLQGISSLFCGLAETLISSIPRNPERTVALRKLLEAKDAAVRAKLDRGAEMLEKARRGETA